MMHERKFHWGLMIFFFCQILLTEFTGVQVMASRPRLDIYINLPALRKLDTMLIVRNLWTKKFAIFFIFFSET